MAQFFIYYWLRLNNFSVWVKFTQGCSWDWDNYFKVNFIVCLVGNLAAGARCLVVKSRGANFFLATHPFFFSVVWHRLICNN